jgi:hypothetical protein
MENFNKKKINPLEFIEKYNNHYNKSFVLNNDLKNKKAVSFKTLIKAFIPMLHKDFKKTKKGGNLDLKPTDTIASNTNQNNTNNFFNYFPRNPEFTNVYNKIDLSTNQVGNDFPNMSTYSRSSF